MKRWITLLLASATLAFSPAHAADNPAESLVKSTSRDVLDIIKRENSPGNERKLREQVEAKVLPHFDFNRMTRLAVGRPWLGATPDQQNALTKEFQRLLVRTYSTALTAYKVQSIDVRTLRQDSEAEIIIRSDVAVVGGSPFPIDFTLYRNTQNAWKVYDVAVDGISFISQYRTQFNQTIKKDGVDGLIKLLVEKNSAPPLKNQIKAS